MSISVDLFGLTFSLRLLVFDSIPFAVIKNEIIEKEFFMFFQLSVLLGSKEMSTIGLIKTDQALAFGLGNQVYVLWSF